MNRYRSRILVASVLLCSASLVYATGSPPSSTPTPVKVKSHAHSNSSSSSGSTSNAVGNGGNGGTASSNQSQSATGGTASNQGNTQSTQIDGRTLYEAQVGTLVQGTVVPVDCGFGGNAGGANTNGLGFLGASWTTDKCYTLKTGTAFAAIGEYDIACELWVDVAKKALARRGVSVDCNAIARRLRAERAVAAVQPSAVAAALQGNYVTVPQMEEAITKAFKKTVSK